MLAVLHRLPHSPTPSITQKLFQSTSDICSNWGRHQEYRWRYFVLFNLILHTKASHDNLLLLGPEPSYIFTTNYWVLRQVVWLWLYCSCSNRTEKEDYMYLRNMLSIIQLPAGESFFLLTGETSKLHHTSNQRKRSSLSGGQFLQTFVAT